MQDNKPTAVAPESYNTGEHEVGKTYGMSPLLVEAMDNMAASGQGPVIAVGVVKAYEASKPAPGGQG